MLTKVDLFALTAVLTEIRFCKDTYGNFSAINEFVLRNTNSVNLSQHIPSQISKPRKPISSDYHHTTLLNYFLTIFGMHILPVILIVSHKHHYCTTFTIHFSFFNDRHMNIRFERRTNKIKFFD